MRRFDKWKETSSYGKKALLLYGKESLKLNGYYERIIKSLKEYSIPWVEHSGVSPNPRLSHSWEGVVNAKEFGAEVIIAAGGGSVVDEAKAIAAGIDCNSIDELWAIFQRENKPQKVLPIIAIMTMPTASEMNNTSVITNDLTREN